MLLLDRYQLSNKGGTILTCEGGAYMRKLIIALIVIGFILLRFSVVVH